MKRHATKGFTLVEIAVTLVIMAILAGVMYPIGVNMRRSSLETKWSNIARSVYLSAQSAMSDLKNSGRLSELAVFGVSSGSEVLTGGYLSGTNAMTGKVDPALVPGSDSTNGNKDYIYYLMSSKAGVDSYLDKLLRPYIGDPAILSNSFCVEVNAKTGNVKAVYYSEDYQAFTYAASPPANTLALGGPDTRLSTYQHGYYGVEDTTGEALSERSTFLTLIDSGSGGSVPDALIPMPNALFLDAYVPNKEGVYTFYIADEMGRRITDAGGKPYAVSFSVTGTGSLAIFSFEDALSIAYKDLEPDAHAGGMQDVPGERRHLLFRESGVKELTGVNGEFVHIVWVLDYIDPGTASEPEARHSIGVLYPLPCQNIRTEVSSPSGEIIRTISNVQHAYYGAEMQEGAGIGFTLTNARHLNNMRYIAGLISADKALDAASQRGITSGFHQMTTIDLSGVDNFAPISWVPTADGTGYIRTGAFTGEYYGKKDSKENHQIYGLSMSSGQASSGYGLFGALKNSLITGLTITEGRVTTSAGGSAGIIAGSMDNSSVTLAAVYGNLRVTGAGSGDTNAGGLVGKMTGGSEINMSYNSGFIRETGFANAIYGIVEVTGHAGFSGKVNIGGLVGAAVNGSISNCYNNVRVNVKDETYVTSGDDENLYIEPENSNLQADCSKINIGGIAGSSSSTNIASVYSTNYLGLYKSGSATSSTGAIVGLRAGGTFANLVAFKNNATSMVNPVDPNIRFSTKDLLSVYHFPSATLWENNTIMYSQRSLPVNNTSGKNSYPYPTLVNNIHLNGWEDIKSGIDRILAWVTSSTGKSVFDERYKAIRIETAHSFYEYASNDMEVTITWTAGQYRLHDTILPEGASLTVDGSTATLTYTAHPGAYYDFVFYSYSQLDGYGYVIPSGDIKVTCKVTTVMGTYLLVEDK